MEHILNEQEEKDWFYIDEMDLQRNSVTLTMNCGLLSKLLSILRAVDSIGRLFSIFDQTNVPNVRHIAVHQSLRSFINKGGLLVRGMTGKDHAGRSLELPELVVDRNGNTIRDRSKNQQDS